MAQLEPLDVIAEVVSDMDTSQMVSECCAAPLNETTISAGLWGSQAAFLDSK